MPIVFFFFVWLVRVIVPLRSLSNRLHLCLLGNCRKEQSSDALNKGGANQFGDALLSKEMLAMLYCMAVIR